MAIALSLLAASCSSNDSVDRAGLWLPWPQLEQGECGVPAADEGDNIHVVVNCDEAHTIEAYATVQLPESVEYDSIDGSACYEAFSNMTGTDFADSGLGGTHVYPDSDSWEQGERGILCLAWTPYEVVKPITELRFDKDLGDMHPWTKVESGWCLGANSLLISNPVAVQVVECEPGSAVVLAQVPVDDFETCQRISRTVDGSEVFLIQSQTMQERGYEKSLCLQWS